MSFESFELHPKLLQAIAALGFEEPTPIQVDAIPPAMAGRDLLACAETGSGKTAAFLLPILHRLLELQQRVDTGPRQTRALVLTPTRELAAQVALHLEGLARFTDIRAATVYGGVAMGPQERAFRDGIDVLVATPGRLLDHLRHPYARLDDIAYLVIDEADRMLDMGFLPDVQEILGLLPERRQTYFLSATIPPVVAGLARQMLRQPVNINIDVPAAPASGVRQAVYPVPEDLKRLLLLEMLKPADIRNVLVFTRTKHRANRLAIYLKKRGVAADRIHGNRTQAQRSQALQDFQDGKTRVLVATNVAARGIDIRDLSHVINYDVPKVPDDYIHRVGRTARAQRTGDALTFVAPHEELDLQAIEEVLGHPLPRLQLESFDYNARVDDRLELPYPERMAALRLKREKKRRAREEREQQKRRREPPSRERRHSAGGRSLLPRRGNGAPPRSDSAANQNKAEINGNVPGTHEQSHLEFLNQDPSGGNGDRRRLRRGAKPDANRNLQTTLPPAPRYTGGTGSSTGNGDRRPASEFRDDDTNPVIPPDFDLPPRESGRPPRPSHQPAALSESGRRYLVGPDEDDA